MRDEAPARAPRWRQAARTVTLIVAAIASLATSPAAPPGISGTASNHVDLNGDTPVAHRRVTVDFNPGGAAAFNVRQLNMSGRTPFTLSDTVAMLVSVGLPDGYAPVDSVSLREVCPTSGHCNVDADVVFALRDPVAEDSFDWNAKASVEFNDASTVPPGVNVTVSIEDVPQAAQAPIIHASESFTLPAGVIGTAERWNLSIRSTGETAPNSGRWLGLLTVDASTSAQSRSRVLTSVWSLAEDGGRLGGIQGSGRYQAELHRLCPTLPTCDVTLGVEANRPADPPPSAPSSPAPEEADLEISVLLVWIGAEAPIGEPTLELELTAP